MGGSIVPPEGRYGSIDSNIVDDALPPGNGADKRAFTYFVLGGARFLYATAARLAVISVVSTLSASADVLALSSVEVDLSSIQMGSTVTVKWRGKPVFIKHRTAEQIAEVSGPAPPSEFRHAQTDAERVTNPNWLIVLGVCTHLGCVPLGDGAGDFGGWFCPCHGSQYDTSGRIRKGPAPRNMEVPVAAFTNETTIKLG